MMDRLATTGLPSRGVQTALFCADAEQACIGKTARRHDGRLNWPTKPMIESADWIVLVSGFTCGALLGGLVTYGVQRRRQRRRASPSGNSGTAGDRTEARGTHGSSERDRRD